MSKMRKSNLWGIILICLFFIVSLINFYEFIISYSPFKLFLGIIFFLFLIYQSFSLKGNYNKFFWGIMIVGILALYLIVLYSYLYGLYGILSPFFIIQVFLTILLTVGLIGLFWEHRGYKKK